MVPRWPEGKCASGNQRWSRQGERLCLSTPLGRRPQTRFAKPFNHASRLTGLAVESCSRNGFKGSAFDGVEGQSPRLPPPRSRYCTKTLTSCSRTAGSALAASSIWPMSTPSAAIASATCRPAVLARRAAWT